MAEPRPEHQQGPRPEAPPPVAPCVPLEIPQTVSPWETWHPEAYLLSHLVRHHGWRVIEPGRLQKPRTRPIRPVPAPARKGAA